MGSACQKAQTVEEEDFGGGKTQARVEARAQPAYSSAPAPGADAPVEVEAAADAIAGEGADSGAAEGKSRISPAELGPPVSLMEPTKPDWRFELDRGNWKSYPLEDSIELDRYWQVFCQKRAGGNPEVCLAQVSLMRKMGQVDFNAMTCTVGGGRPRALRREVKEDGWLSNAYFWEAFKAALSASGAEVQADGSADKTFDFRYNQDFREMKDDGRPLYRGGQRYELPIGWKRFAVHVKGLYDNGDNSWLKEDESGWAVAYHGTSGAGLAGILSSGFNVGARQKFEDTTGAGIYCTPWINVAQHYSKPQNQEGHSVQIVLQLRVRPSAIKHITDANATDFEKKYWVINKPEDIRAYGVLIRELSIMDYIVPEEMVFGKDHPAVKRIYKELRGT